MHQINLENLLKTIWFVQIMSLKGNCWDNAVAESFFHTLKTECLYRLDKNYSIDELRQILFDYIEVFYIRKRRHSSLGYLSPMEFARQIA
jgi:transposase InsO family protein